MVKKRKTNFIPSRYNHINKEKCTTCHTLHVSLKHHLAQDVCIPTNSINMNINSFCNYPDIPPITQFAINESSYSNKKLTNHNDNNVNRILYNNNNNHNLSDINNDTFMETNNEIFYDFDDGHSLLAEPSSA